jgi:hypothetical protein
LCIVTNVQIIVTNDGELPHFEFGSRTMSIVDFIAMNEPAKCARKPISRTINSPS